MKQSTMSPTLHQKDIRTWFKSANGPGIHNATASTTPARTDDSKSDDISGPATAEVASVEAAGHAIEAPDAKLDSVTEGQQAVEVNEPKPVPKRVLPKIGEPIAAFCANFVWNRSWRKYIGTSTKEIIFGTEFVLEDHHIDQLLSLGPLVCRGLASFQFIYVTVACVADNNAVSLTDNALVRLASACPNLVNVQIPGTAGLGDASLHAFLARCPKLKVLEISDCTWGASSKLTPLAFEKFRENRHWAPRLKSLRVSKSTNKCVLRAVKALSRRRPALSIRLVEMSEVIKWGDWEIEEWDTLFQRGKEERGW
ncbi:hypothetical protein B0I35DRAFT_446123 [Stachybotrys elegans]|uniref:F-box domain-containing protein n=1 Tax=Stachybotrys elegans TaxID=80388 RepID=A0A8K0SHX3_9HYPO|nr:hypothetical protein B0I35DRAFT_446123 [Stachybotrys elegans]